MFNFALVNQLKRHIEILLLDNDCVIVPDFGGFVAHHVPARYDEEDKLFLPPMRTLGFNSQLRMNDSLLVQSYIEAYDISYPEALQRIEQETNELKRILEESGQYTLDDLGTLTVNMDGHYEFEPFKYGLLSPDVYGLADVKFHRLNDQEAEPVAEALPTEPVEEKTEEEEPTPALLEFLTSDDDEKTAIQIKMSWVRNTIAIAASILAFFLFATPIANSDMGSKTMSQLQGNILYKLIPKDTNVMPAQPVIRQQIVKSDAAKKADNNAKTTAVATPQPEVPVAASPKQAKDNADTYCIVVASQVKKSNAELFVEKLHKQGYPEAEVFIYNNVVRVICGTFATEAKAYSRLNQLNSKEDFFEAWVYKKKAV